MSSKNQFPFPSLNTSPTTRLPHDFVARLTMPRKLALVGLHRRTCLLTQSTSWIQGAPPLGVKQESQGVQDQEPVAGFSQVLWDEWARYQSNLRKPDDPGKRRCPLSVPGARLYKTLTSSPSYSGETRAPCPTICGTNPYHSITTNRLRII